MKTSPQTKRANWHDYRSPCRYMITLSKSAGIIPFSQIEGDWRLPVGTRGSSYTRWSPIGREIADKLYNIRDIHPALTVEQYIVMPDHMHALIWVKSTLLEHLGFFIARFKNAINTAVGIDHIFEDGFNDQIVTHKRDLNTIFNYIRTNPYRLAISRAYPDFFTRCNNLIIGDTPCQLYGNLHLLDNPFKDQVIVHRADDDQTFLSNRDRWLHTAANGGVLVSPFISQREKSIRKEAESTGGKLILITNRPLGEREKPSGKDFDLCAQGRLLIIAPSTPMPLDRSSCLKMNALANTIVGK
ncbi:MAG: hypothetical protein K2O47_08335 [Muribaculaceae bacterium]|nr:hypothetical protein [Muribaculaceae bacterium]